MVGGLAVVWLFLGFAMGGLFLCAFACVVAYWFDLCFVLVGLAFAI